ncbi:DUF305 domain-containing protein [Streptosporangium sp. CA-115845]|uniref:DUF305 domain-containing protein n=1 Tax=Streptosporangium sp. CA-115845 TaxID=3240071 RepID=UPI003D935ED9
MISFVVPRLAVMAGLTAITAVTSAGCGSTGEHATPAAGRNALAPAVGGTSTAAFNDADVLFAQMMIPHHRQAVEMADLAATRATDAQVRRLAATIKAAQEPEIATMTGWLKSWGRPEPSAGHGGDHGMNHGEMPGMMSETYMARLRAASGKDFDRLFLTGMIAHHQGAVTMARQEIANGANPGAKALAERIATSQQAEIDTMNRILARL